MSAVSERSKVFEVPAGSGVEGFVHLVREALKLPRVQRILIEIGKVTVYQRAGKQEVEDTLNLDVDFEHLQPYNIIRNVPARELSYPDTLGGSAAIAAMLDAVVLNDFTPIAFVASPTTLLWTWLHFRDDVDLKSRDTLFGYPLHADKQIPDTAIVLCAGVDKTTALIDTRLSLKLEMKSVQCVLQEVDIL
jgi:hypothetical protein